MRRLVIGLLAVGAIAAGAAPAAAACRGAGSHPTHARISTINRATLCLLNIGISTCREILYILVVEVSFKSQQMIR